MSSVTFHTAVGGDGSTVTDDSNPATGLDAGGHRVRFVPALAQTVAVAANVVATAEQGADSATEAAASALAASGSATAAAGSASAAADSATEAAASALAASGSATAAAGSASAAADSATEAAASALAASGSATAAAGSAGAAADSASQSEASSLASADSASTSSTQATEALAQANNAAASALAADASATSAATSATAAGTAATAAATTLISAVTQRPAITPSLSVDWTKKPTAAALTAAGWTVSRAGEMTYFGAAPVKVAENLFVRSQGFQSWNGAGLSSNSAVTDESGLVGLRLVSNTSTSTKGTYQTVYATNLGSQTYRVRVLAKAAEYPKVMIADAGSGRAGACFNLATGQVVNASNADVGASASGAGNGYGPGYVSHNITAHELGGGLYWCELVMTSSTAGSAWLPFFSFYPGTGATISAYGASYTGDDTSGIEVYAAQLQHNFDGDYVPTTDVTITRYESPLLTAAANELAYQHNSRGECVGLLQYPADTNLILQSQNLGTSPWAGSEVSAKVTKRLWAGSAPFFRLLKTTSNAGQTRSQAITTAVALNATYTTSIALLGDRWSTTTSGTVELVRGSDTADVGVNADSTAVIISGPGTLTQASGARWNITGLSYDTPTVIRVTRTYRATDTGLAVRIYPGSATSTTLGAAILATRVHVAAGDMLMPYIPTTTAAVTRGAQTWTYSTTSISSPAEGTLLVRASVEDAVWSAARVAAALDFSGSSNFRHAISSAASTGAATGSTVNAGTTQASAVASTFSTAPATAAYAYTTNSMQLATNGTLSTLDTAGTMPSVNRLGSSTWAGLIQRTELYPRAMTSAELAAITTQGVLQ